MYRAIFEEHFNELEDKRYANFVEHKLIDVLIAVTCGVLCGLDELQDIVTYAKTNMDFLHENFGVETAPSKSTLTRVLNMVNGEKLATSILTIMREALGIEGEVVAFDGKTICSTTKGNREKIHIISAYLTQNGVTLAQEAVSEKTNEIPVMQEMLRYLSLKGKVVTADAMHWDTAKLIIDAEADYILGLKGNQGTLLADISLYLDDCIAEGEVTEKEQTTEKNGGRIETRTLYKSPTLDWLENHEQWAGLRCAFAIDRVTKTPNGTTSERSYYITSLDKSAERLLFLTREHWKIEAMHHMLDVTFSEDNCKVLSSNGQKTLNVLRKLALAFHAHYINSLTQKTKPSRKNNMLQALLSPKHLLAVIGVCLTNL